VFLHLLSGTIVFKYAEDYTWRDSLYFCITTFTTVGYGDVWPQKVGSRIFNIWFILFGMSIVAASVGSIVSWMHHQTVTRYGSKKKMEQTVTALSWSLLRHVLVLVFVLSVGAVWYIIMEESTVLNGIYWATITSCTIGYGMLPIGDATRSFNCFYLLAAVVTMAFVLGKIVELISAIELQQRIELFSRQKLSTAMITDIDTASFRGGSAKNLTGNMGQQDNGEVDRLEFLTYLLINTGKVTSEDIDSVHALFDRYDHDGNGVIDRKDITSINEEEETQRLSASGKTPHSFLSTTPRDV